MTTPATEPRQLGLVGRIVIALTFLAGLGIAVPTSLGLLWYVPYAAVGSVLIVRRPRTTIGWLLLGIALCSLPLFVGQVAATVASFADGSVPLPTKAYAVIHAASGPLAFVLFSVLAMVFPSGLLPSGRWGRIARAALVFELCCVVLTVISPTISVPIAGLPANVDVPNPIAVLPGLPIWQLVNPSNLFVPVFPIFAGAVVSLVVRFRGATGIERQQLRWIGASLTFVVIAIAMGFVLAAAIPDSQTGFAWTLATVAFPTVPVAIGVAVLRYRLYEIDTIINRAIVYGLLTAVVAGASAAAIALTQRLFSGVIGAASDLAIVFITLGVVAAVNPVKTKLQAIVDRRFKEVRDPGKELSSFLAGVHGSLSRPDRDRTLQRFLEAAVLAFSASGGQIRLEGAGRERSFQAAGSNDRGGRGDGQPDADASELRARASAGRLRAEISLSGGDWSRGATALEPAFAGVLGELATTPGQVGPA